MFALQRMGPFLLGMTLFSMFFGSGNVVFPLVVGKIAQEDVIYSMGGFLITAVLLPLLGVLAMVLYNGSYTRFFCRYGKIPGFLAMIALLTVWIPLGSGPRCVAVAFGSIRYYTPWLPLWAFSLLACSFIYFFTLSRRRMLELLGYVLTPALLLSLAIIVLFGLRDLQILGSSALSGGEAFYMGLTQGYHTMDLIASFFFSSTVIYFIRQTYGHTDEEMGSEQIKMALKACFFGALLLGIVYIGFMLIAAGNSAYLEGVPSHMILPTLAMHLIGPNMRVVATIVVSLSCMTTAIALVFVYADFLTRHLFPETLSRQKATILTIFLIFIFSVFDFDGISAIVNPMLQIFYPPLILLVLWNSFVKITEQ